MNRRRRGHSIIAIKKHIYSFGGYDERGHVDTVERLCFHSDIGKQIYEYWQCLGVQKNLIPGMFYQTFAINSEEILLLGRSGDYDDGAYQVNAFVFNENE